MSRHLYIGGYERNWRDLESPKDNFRIDMALTYEIDTLQFKIRGTQPTEGQEVIIEDDDLGRLFAGTIEKVDLDWTSSDKTINVWAVDCSDYTVMLDRRLVVEIYENYTADDIIKDIITKYCSGFTATNVQSGAPVIETTGSDFNYLAPSECFKWLCDYTGWQWYVDYDKDIHFFNPSILTEAAPMSLATGGRFRNFTFTIDQKGLRNRVYVRGGTMLSDYQTIEWAADGVARQWTLPWGPHDVTFEVGGSAVTVGIENIDDESSYDFMLNFTEKYIRCAVASTPTVGTTLSLTAKQDIDVITYSENTASQTALAAAQGGDGVYEYSFTDDSLTTLQAAGAAADADLREHADPTVTGSFETEISGWATGQLVPIFLTDRGINNTYVVQKVTITAPTKTIWTFTVEFGGRLLGVADFLKALVSAQQKKKLGATEIIHKIRIFDEDTVDVTDSMPEPILFTPPYYCRGTVVVFTRSSIAYKQDGSQVASGIPRYEPATFDQGIMIEEGTINLLTANQSSVETDTTGFVNTSFGSSTMTRDTSKAWHGSASIKVTSTDAEQIMLGLSTELSPRPAIAGQSYTASAKMIASVAGRDFLPGIGFLDSGGGYLDSTTGASVISSTTGWQDVSATMTAPAGTAFVYLTGILYGCANGDSFNLDGLQIEQKSYATSWQLGSSTRAAETLTVPTAGVLSPSEGSIEMAFYVNESTQIQGYGKTLFAARNGIGWLCMMGYISVGGIYFEVRDDEDMLFSCDYNNTSIPVGWHKAAFTWNSTHLKIFLDGVDVGEEYEAPRFSTSLAANLYIGSEDDTYSFVNTVLDDLRISSRARTLAEHQAYVASGEPIPLDGETTCLLRFDGNLNDNSDPVPHTGIPVCGFILCSS
jgi:hypothetical protein